METLKQQYTTKPTIPKKDKGPFFKAQSIQKKLSIGASNDPYEAEADAMADKVVSMSDAYLDTNQHTGSLIQKKCQDCEEEMLQKKSLASEITPLVQRKSQEAEAGSAPQALTQQINSSRGNGQNMNKGTQNYMESRFGADFSDVKIHTDAQAVQMNRNLSAKAFTVGNDIYFNEGTYNPRTNSGKHLLAHELTHTIQQGKKVGHKIQRMLDCPTTYSSDDPIPDGWIPYHGNPDVFHCGYTGLIEDRIPTPDDPQNECFYDSYSRLVDENHENSACGGSPNQYDSDENPLKHTFLDSGGILRSGWAAFWRSRFPCPDSIDE